LKLDLYKLARQGFVRPGAWTGPKFIRWTYTYTGEHIASGEIWANMAFSEPGYFRIQIGSLDQRILLEAEPRHFGGQQWYFVCPSTGRRASVLWMPPGARSFASRQAWRRQVAYATQFGTP
jgi:hypothetical protein